MKKSLLTLLVIASSSVSSTASAQIQEAEAVEVSGTEAVAVPVGEPAPPLVPDGKPVFLVTDLVVAPDVPLDANTARDALATRFGRLKDKIEVRSLTEMRASLDAAAMQQLMGNGDDVDLSKIEQYGQVDRLVLGRVAMVGGIIEVQVKVFNVDEGVTEVAFARRLGKNADRAMLLALIDSLADALLAWTINTYTDGSLSKEASALANKKLDKKGGVDEVKPSPWSPLGAVGGVFIGAGAVALAGGTVLAIDDQQAQALDLGLLIGGGAAVVLGGVLIAVDVVTE